MGNRKVKASNVLYGIRRSTNGGSVILNRVDPPKHSNSATVIKRKTKIK